MRKHPFISHTFQKDSPMNVECLSKQSRKALKAQILYPESGIIAVYERKFDISQDHITDLYLKVGKAHYSRWL